MQMTAISSFKGRVVLVLQNGQVEQVRSAILKTDRNKTEQVTLQVICLFDVFTQYIFPSYPGHIPWMVA